MGKSDQEAQELTKLRKEIWEKAVDTQMHFNEMSVKSRQLGLSFVVGALGLAVVILGRNEPSLLYLPIPFTDSAIGFHISGLIVLIAAVGVYAVRKLDLGVYHQMLRGAVKFGEELEASGLRAEVMKTPHGMTEFISLYSRHKVVRKDAKGHYVGESQRFAGSKIARFYTYLTWSLVLMGVVLTLIFLEVHPRHVAIGPSKAPNSPPLVTEPSTKSP